MSNNTTPAQRMAAEPVDKVIEVLKERCSWPLMKRLLAERNLKPGMGWADLKVRAAKGDADSPTIQDLVRSAYLGSLVGGARYVQLYELEPSVAAAVQRRLAGAVIQPSPFSVRYPLPLVGAALDSAPGEFTLCEVLSTGDAPQLIFCSRQVVEESLTIDAASSPTVMSTFSQALSGYDKFVAYRRKSIQVFDVITFRPNLKRMEIALDITQRSSDFDGEARALKLLFHAALLVPELEQVLNLHQGMNLFPAITEIYKSASGKDTKINDIGFRTPSGAVNRGKMPSTIDDIRDEAFHKGGSERVDKKINPYGVSVTWTFSFPKGSARVKLWTTAAKAMEPTPYLWGMYVTDVAGNSDMVQAVNKVTSFL